MHENARKEEHKFGLKSIYYMEAVQNKHLGRSIN